MIIILNIKNTKY